VHLDARTYRGLLDGTLAPGEARALSAHLEGACDVCEGFLSARFDVLDARADRALAAVGRGEAGDEVELARILRRVEARYAPRRRRTGVRAAAAVIALVGVAGLVVARERIRPAWTGEKGAAAAASVPVRLRLVVVEGAGAAAAVHLAVPGELVPSGAAVALELELSRPADVAVVRVAARGGAPETIWSARAGRGRTEVSAGGRPAAYPLAGLVGPQRFAAIASEAPLDPARLARAAAKLAAPADAGAAGAAADGLSIDAVEVVVR
jgi:hypothetical protein